VDRFGGWYPLIGLGTFIAISKELFVLNEEALMITNFAAFVFISWMAAGDAVNEAVKAKAEALRKHNDDVSDLYIESLQQVIRAGESSLAILPLMQRLKQQYAALGEDVLKAKEMKSRQAARAAVVSRLNSVYQTEQAEKAKYVSRLLDEVLEEVQHRLEDMSAGEKDAMIDEAIRMLESGQEEVGQDRATRIYQEVLQSRLRQEEERGGEQQHATQHREREE